MKTFLPRMRSLLSPGQGKLSHVTPDPSTQDDCATLATQLKRSPPTRRINLDFEEAPACDV